MDKSQIENTMSLCTPPDLGKIDNFAATAYLVKKYQECKDEQQNYEVIISKLNTTVKSNFYKVLNEGISKKWPDTYIQTRETDYERLVLTKDGKEAYTKVLNMLDLNYKTVNVEEAKVELVKEDETLKKRLSEQATSSETSKLNSLAPGKKRKKEDTLSIKLSGNYLNFQDYNKDLPQGIVLETNRYDHELVTFLQQLDSKDKWYDYNSKKWIIKNQEAMALVMSFIQKQPIVLIDNRPKNQS